MPLKTKLAGDQTVKPGPADYHLGKVRQPARLSSSALPRAALPHPPVPTGLLGTRHLAAATARGTAARLPWPRAEQRQARQRGSAFPVAQPFHAAMRAHITSSSGAGAAAEGTSRPGLRTGHRQGGQGRPARPGWS
ncbi:uncharacterized protein VSU04_004440 [Chlamydotis macqueenii]